MATHTFDRASSVAATPTGRANNAPNPSAPPTFDCTRWAHLRHGGATHWATPPWSVAPFFRRSLPSPENVNYTSPTTRPSFPSADHTQLHRSMPTLPCLRPSNYPPVSAFRDDEPVGSARVTRHHLFLLECLLGCSAGFALFLVGLHGYLHPLVAPPLSEMPGAQDFARNKIDGLPFPCCF